MNMNSARKRTTSTLAILALCASVNVHAANAFDANTNLLSIDSITVNGVAYQHVTTTVHSFTLLGMDSGFAGTDSFDATTNVLTLGSVVFQGSTYNNVRVRINSHTLVAFSLAPNEPQTPPTVPGALTAANTCALANFQSDLMTLINQARASSRVCGSTTFAAAAPLAWNSKLFDAAAGHSADMAAKNYFSHTSQDGRTFDQRISAAGYSWSRIGENIAAGQSTVASVMAAWMGSAGHCANIMNSSYTEVATACVSNGSSSYGKYWTMNLGRP